MKNAIAAPLSGDVITTCFGPDPTHPSADLVAQSDPLCQAIDRNLASGGLSGSTASVGGLPIPLTNSGRLNTDGVDLTANYRRSLGFANLTLNFSGNWTHKSQFFALPVSQGPNCPGVYSANCGISIGQLQPKWSWNQRTTLSFKPVDVSLNWRHLSSFHYQHGLPVLCDADNPPFDPNDKNNPNNNPKGCTGEIRGSGPLVGKTAHFDSIPAYDYFDLTTRFTITDHFDLTLSAFNIFDKQPPIVGNGAGTTSAGSGNTFPSTYDALGRRYSASVRLKF